MLDELKTRLEKNAQEAEELRDMISDKDKNLFNEQFVMDWQDRLNAVSITREIDVIS